MISRGDILTKYHDVILAISKQLNWNCKLIQLWRISNRKNATIGPNRYLSPNNDIIQNKNNKNEEKDDENNDESGTLILAKISNKSHPILH